MKEITKRGDMKIRIISIILLLLAILTSGQTVNEETTKILAFKDINVFEHHVALVFENEKGEEKWFFHFEIDLDEYDFYSMETKNTFPVYHLNEENVGKIYYITYKKDEVMGDFSGEMHEMEIVTNIKPVNKTKTNGLTPLKIMKSMFPDRKFTIDEDRYKDDMERVFYIDTIIEGAFTQHGKEEILAIVKRDKETLHPMQGWYFAYLAVFDVNSEQIKTDALDFWAGKSGETKLYYSKGTAYLLFIGETVDDGWVSYEVKLYKCEEKWKEQNPTGGYSKYDDVPMKIEDGKINVYHRIIISEPDEPVDYKLAYQYTLKWDPVKAHFIREK